MKTRIDALTSVEESWIAERLTDAEAFVTKYSPHNASNPIELATLDAAYADWVDTGTQQAEEVNQVINAVAVVFGQALAEAARLEWVIATDECGSDLALHGDPGKSDILIYPTSFVAKRWEKREKFFLLDSLNRIVADIRELRS